MEAKMKVSRWIVNALAYSAVAASVGCTVAQEKGRIYRDAAEKFSVPDKVRVCYDREGDTQAGAEYRCFGRGCVLPACPGDDL